MSHVAEELSVEFLMQAILQGITNTQHTRDVRNELLISSSSISTWGTIKTNTYLYRVIQYLHNGV